jgi:hypothetical protein
LFALVGALPASREGGVGIYVVGHGWFVGQGTFGGASRLSPSGEFLFFFLFFEKRYILPQIVIY